MSKSMKPQARGMTIVDVLISVVVMGIVASLIIPKMMIATDTHPKDNIQNHDNHSEMIDHSSHNESEPHASTDEPVNIENHIKTAAIKINYEADDL